MYIDLEIGLELLLEIELGIRLIMNLEVGLVLLEIELEVGLGLLEEMNLEVLLLEEMNLEVLLLVLPYKIIFFVSIFLSRRSSYPDSPPTPNQFQYPRQDQMTLNILLLIINY